MNLGDFSDRDWYGRMLDDAAMLGDREAERRRFGHEDARQVRPSTMTEWMRERREQIAADPETAKRDARLTAFWARFDAEMAVKFGKTRDAA